MMHEDILEGSELSALATPRSGFRNDTMHYEKFRRSSVPRGTDKYSNFSFQLGGTNLSFLEAGNWSSIPMPTSTNSDKNWIESQVTQNPIGVLNDGAATQDQKKRAQALYLSNTYPLNAACQSLSDSINSMDAEKIKKSAAYMANNAVFNDYRNKLQVAYDTCTNAQQQKDIMNNLGIIAATTGAAKAGLGSSGSGTNKLLLYGGIGVGVLAFGFIVYKIVKR